MINRSEGPSPYSKRPRMQKKSSRKGSEQQAGEDKMAMMENVYQLGTYSHYLRASVDNIRSR